MFVFLDSCLVTNFVFVFSLAHIYCIVSSNHLGYEIVTLDFIILIHFPRAARVLLFMFYVLIPTMS